MNLGFNWKNRADAAQGVGLGQPLKSKIDGWEAVVP
jgi:hypothetical protein